jgi:hypothetical protein
MGLVFKSVFEFSSLDWPGGHGRATASAVTGNMESLRWTTRIQTIFFLPPWANKSKPEYFSTLKVEYIGNERWQWAVPWSWCCSSTGSFRGIMLRYICETYYAIQRIEWQRSSEIHFATLVRVCLFWERGCWNTVRVHKGEKCFLVVKNILWHC